MLSLLINLLMPLTCTVVTRYFTEQLYLGVSFVVTAPQDFS